MSAGSLSKTVNRCIPADIDDGWTIAAPESVGIDGAALASVVDWLDGVEQSNVHSLVVTRRGALVFEHYRKGPDVGWDERVSDTTHGPTKRHSLRSATKSVTGLLVGIAHDRKLIPSLDKPVFEYFPDCADLRSPEKDRILLRHLLTMSAGLEWDENVDVTDPRNGEARMWRSPDRLRTALEPPLVTSPGEVWNYAGGCTELLGAVLHRVAGRPIDAFARETLFEPLGIVDWAWGSYGGFPGASGSLHMRARDLAKIGQLVSNRGRWGERQIVSAEWIDDSLAPHIGAPDRLQFYGYQWWLGRSLVRRKEIIWACATGYGGQRLYVVPALDFAAVTTMGHYGEPMQGWLPLVMLNRFLLPSVRES